MFVKKLIKLIKRSKFKFGKPEKSNFILFDCETSKPIKYLLKDKKFYILKIRSDKIDEIYLNLSILLHILTNLFSRSLKINYLSALLIQMNPKVIVTQYDNSLEFYQLNTIFKESNIKFIAVQGGIRTKENMIHLRKSFYIDQYCAFSNYEKNFFKENGYIANIFSPIGSVTSAAALDYFKTNKIDLRKEYDVCLISELIYKTDDKIDQKYLEMLEDLSLLVKNLKLKKDFNLIICGSGNEDSKISKVEKEFYEKIFGKNNFKIDQSDRNKYPSYKNILKSNLVIGVHSTLMREALGLKKKNPSL
tara:strand:- start:255 stop:1169 length:915 start_codon:yes stop_codon:yes gene_type:complete